MRPILGEAAHAFKFLTGNRCGYSNAPILGPPHPHPFIERAREQAKRLFTERHTGELWRNRKRWRRRVGGGNFQSRNPRGERAKATSQVSRFLLGRMDLKNLRVIDLKTGAGISIAEIAKGAGVSVDRCNAALFELTCCGHLRGRQDRYVNEDGETRGEIASRYFTRRFFASLRLWRAFCRVKGLDKATPEPPLDGRIVGQLATAKAMPAHDLVDKRAKIAAVFLQLKLKHPEWPDRVLQLTANARFR